MGKVLIACEFSGIVRDAFAKKNHKAFSCDLLPTESRYYILGGHYQNTLEKVISLNPIWDLIIAFPPCTHLAVSGARWWKNKEKEQEEALNFVTWIAELNCDKIAIENPIGKLSTAWRKPDQIIQPWQFGHGETKSTCLWLKNLPPLVPTNVVEGREPRVHKESPGPNRWKNRSRTYTGIAEAMAEQWGALV